MDYVNIILAIACLAVLGALFGFILAVASKVFYVKVDERIPEIEACLPGANCGGCGFAGCSAYATAVAEGRAETNRCQPGGAAVAAKVAEIMGVSAGAVERSVALVKCSGGENATKRFRYVGLTDCLSAARLASTGPNDCAYGCLGLGSCVAVCPFDAIHVEHGVAKVDHSRCVGCMACAQSCPQNLIIKVPYQADVVVACASHEKGGVLRSYCNIGCIGCKICEKNCAFDAIHVLDNLAEIDYSKCMSCGACAQKCPRHLIRDTRLNTAGDAASA